MCDCKLAGWCERHRVSKTDRMVELCQEGGRYWEAWESGRFQEDKPPEKKPVLGPGSHLRILIKEKGYEVKHQGCGCNDKAAKMDLWGPRQCRKNIDEIVSWLEESARGAGWLERLAVTAPFVKDYARKEIKKMIIEAIERSEKEL